MRKKKELLSNAWLDLLLYQGEKEKQIRFVSIPLYSGGRHFAVLPVKINLVLIGCNNAVASSSQVFENNLNTRILLLGVRVC